MLTQFRLFLAQLIAPKGYEVADFDYVQQTATNCYFRGKHEAYHDILSRMKEGYGIDWRSVIYNYVKYNTECYGNIVNPSHGLDPESE